MNELLEPHATQHGLPVSQSEPPSFGASHARAVPAVFEQPRYHCQEEADVLRLVVRVPGADPAGIDLEVTAPDLTVTAARNRPMPQGGRSSPVQAEIRDYQLRLRLGFGLAYDALHAELHGGELIVTIPKMRRHRSRNHTGNGVSRFVYA